MIDLPQDEGGSVWVPINASTNEIPSSAARRLRLFCLPFAGGLASFYRLWAGMLPSGVDVLAWEYEGHGFRKGQAPSRSVTEIAQSLVRVVAATGSTPYAFFGHSMGAMVAFEACRIATQQISAAPSILFVSGCRAPMLPKSEAWHMLSDEQLLRLLMNASSKDNCSRLHLDLMRLSIRTIRHDLHLIERHLFSNNRNLRCRLVAFGGSNDPLVEVSHLIPWASLTTGSFELKMLEGSHLFISSSQERLLEEICRDLVGVNC